MAKFIFDESHAPIIIGIAPATATAEEIACYASDLANILSKYDRIFYLLDTSKMTKDAGTFELRTTMADGFNNIIDMFNTKVAARAQVILESSILGGMTTFYWLLNDKLTSPRRVFSSREEAINWLYTQKLY